jgi:hypothetical protein
LTSGAAKELTHRSTSGYRAVLEEAVEYGTIVSHIVYPSARAMTDQGERPTFDLLLAELVRVVRIDTVQEVDVFVRMKLGHLALRGRLGPLIKSAMGSSSNTAPQLTKISIFLYSP